MSPRIFLCTPLYGVRNHLDAYTILNHTNYTSVFLHHCSHQVSVIEAKQLDLFNCYYLPYFWIQDLKKHTQVEKAYGLRYASLVQACLNLAVEEALYQDRVSLHYFQTRTAFVRIRSGVAWCQQHFLSILPVANHAKSTLRHRERASLARYE